MAIYTGTTSNDSYTGTSDSDLFDMTQIDFSMMGTGGSDYVDGGAGDDTFLFGAALTGDDTVIGGGGRDALILEGDYSGGLTFGPNIRGIEELYLGGNYTYDITLTRSTVGVGVTFEIDMGDGGGEGTLILDASQVRGNLLIVTEGGDDYIVSGAGNDLIGVYEGGDDTAYGGRGDDVFETYTDTIWGDRLDGGAGYDEVWIGNTDGLGGGGGGGGALAAIGFRPLYVDHDMLTNIEAIRVFDFEDDVSLYLASDLLQDGQNFLVDASAQGRRIGRASGPSELFSGLYVHSLFLDGSDSLGDLTVKGGLSDDTIFGGYGDDSLSGSRGRDILEGSEGADTINGGAGGDLLIGEAGSDTYVYTRTGDSGPKARDFIIGLQKIDVIDLSAIDADSKTDGDQAFILVESFTGHAGEAVLSFDSGAGKGGITTLSLDVNGDGKADMAIDIAGDKTAFEHFVL